MKNNVNDVPIPSGPEVYWERWVDPFDEDPNTPEDTAPMSEEDTYLSDEDMQLSEEEQMMQEFQSLNGIKTIFTPFGIMPLTEQSLVSNHFKLWVGHSNFKLTNRFYRVIGKVDGVESLDILTPYRFRVAIGKLFQDRNVMSEIRKAMILALEDI